MRRPLLGWAFAVGVSLLAPGVNAQAQTGFNDPFSLYYGFYLPHQAAVAAQSTPLDTINAATAARIPMASDRTGLYDPISPFGEDDLDPLRPYSSRRGGDRVGRPHQFPSSVTAARGSRLSGAAVYYNRTARYYSTLRPGVNPNRNLAVTRRGGGSMGGGGGFSGGGGMPSMPGPR